MFRAPVAVHLLLVEDGRILLLRRYNTGFADESYSTIAGHIDGGEDLKTAMIREAREEAGIEVSRSNLKVVGAMHVKGDDEYFYFFLRASEWSGEVTNMEPEKCDDLRWFDLSRTSRTTQFHTSDVALTTTLTARGLGALAGNGLRATVAS